MVAKGVHVNGQPNQPLFFFLLRGRGVAGFIGRCGELGAAGGWMCWGVFWGEGWDWVDSFTAIAAAVYG